MAGDEQFVEVDACQSALAIIVGKDNLAEDALVDTGLDLAHLCLTDDALRDVADFLLVFLLDGRALAFCRRAVSSTG